MGPTCHKLVPVTGLCRGMTPMWDLSICGYTLSSAKSMSAWTNAWSHLPWTPIPIELTWKPFWVMDLLPKNPTWLRACGAKTLQLTWMIIHHKTKASRRGRSRPWPANKLCWSGDLIWICAFKIDWCWMEWTSKWDWCAAKTRSVSWVTVESESGMWHFTCAK